MTVYKPDIFTSSYIDSRNILALCYKDLDKNISRIIDSYLFEYDTGFANFDNREYIINNQIIHKNKGGHPLEPILILLSKYCRDTDNEIFNQILEKINNVHNNKKIDLTECLTYIIQKKRNIINELDKPSDYYIVYNLIDKYIGKIKIDNKHIYMRCIRRNNEYIEMIDRDEISIILNKKLNSLAEIIIEKSQYNSIKEYRINRHIYLEKYLIINNNIITFTINRFLFNDVGLTFDYNKLDIPYILNLPNFVFENNDKKQYELIAVIIYNNNLKQYSIIIKQNNNFYHYLYDKIIEVDNKYFNEKTSSNSTQLYYKMI